MDKQSNRERLVFAEPTIWYEGDEGRFLLSHNKEIYELSSKELNAVKNLTEATEQDVSQLLESGWVQKVDEQQQERQRLQGHVQNLHNLFTAAYKPKLTTTAYHQTEMDEAFTQFDDVETTCSHVLREPTPILHGRTYGQALADWARSWLPNQAKVLEIGGGTGIIANHFLTALCDFEIDYTLLDLSPQLQQSQIEQSEAHTNIRFLSGDVLEYDFGNERFDLIFSNEMIADLPISVADKERIAHQKAETVAEAYILRYQLDTEGAFPKFCVNTGAIDLIERLPQWLQENGRILLTEYGARDRFPTAVPLKGHREHSIHFGHLQTAAVTFGLQSDYLTVGELLRADETLQVLDFKQTQLLCKVLAPFLGIEMDMLLYTAEQLAEIWQSRYAHLGNLQFVPVSQVILSPFIFKALVLRHSIT